MSGWRASRRPWRRMTLTASLCALTWWPVGQAAATTPGESQVGIENCRAATPVEPARYLLVITGLGGEPYYENLFERWGRDFAALAVQNLGLPPACILRLSSGRARLADDPGQESASLEPPGTSVKPEVLAAITDVAENSQPGDIVMVFAAGHGTARGEDVRFNLPGPDLGPAELDQVLDTLPGRRLALILASSASGAFLERVSRPGRIVVTATASGQENRHARFGGAFVEAYGAPESDTDKSGEVSLTEAVEYARRRVEAIYKSERRLQTEHAVLEDHDAGRLAGTYHLGVPPAFRAGEVQSPEVLALERDARRLLDSIEALKRGRRGLSQEEFDTDLEALLVQLAYNRRELRTLKGTGQPDKNAPARSSEGTSQ